MFDHHFLSEVKKEQKKRKRFMRGKARVISDLTLPREYWHIKNIDWFFNNSFIISILFAWLTKLRLELSVQSVIIITMLNIDLN